MMVTQGAATVRVPMKSHPGTDLVLLAVAAGVDMKSLAVREFELLFRLRFQIVLERDIAMLVQFSLLAHRPVLVQLVWPFAARHPGC